MGCQVSNPGQPDARKMLRVLWLGAQKGSNMSRWGCDLVNRISMSRILSLLTGRGCSSQKWRNTACDSKNAPRSGARSVAWRGSTISNREKPKGWRCFSHKVTSARRVAQQYTACVPDASDWFLATHSQHPRPTGILVSKEPLARRGLLGLD